MKPGAGAFQVITTARGARARSGVATGAERAEVERAYPRARCTIDPPEIAVCTVGRVPRSEAEPGSPRDLRFGFAQRGPNAGRVGSIWLVATSPRGLAER